jgi:hypothetical protein
VAAPAIQIATRPHRPVIARRYSLLSSPLIHHIQLLDCTAPFFAVRLANATWL